MTRQLRRSTRGSVVVEYLGILPLLLVVAMLILQGLTAVTVSTAAEDAARMAARAAARGDDPLAAARSSLPGWLDGRIEDLDVTTDGPLVTATIDVSIPAVAGLVTGDRTTGRATFERS